MTLKRRLIAGFLTSLLVLVVGVFAYDALSSAGDARGNARRAREAIDSILAVRSGLLDEERGERGFLLTSDPAYLSHCKEGSSAVEANVRALRTAIGGDPAQSAELDALEPELLELSGELDKTIRLEQAKSHEAALEEFGRGDANTHLERALGKLDAMLASEKSVLDSRRAGYERALGWTRVVVVLGSLVAFLLGTFVNLGIWQVEKRSQRDAEEHAKREAAQRLVLEDYDRTRLEKQRALTESLRIANLQLDEHVRELAAARTAQDRALGKREQAMVALEKTNVELDQFAYVASHDLKAPLRGIANLSEWIEEDLGAAMTDQSREHLKLLRGRIYRMESLIDGILAYSRAGRTHAATETIEISRFVSETIELLAPPEGVVDVSMAEGLVRVDAEKVPLQQVFMNLIGNALKHASGTKARVEITGKDTGAGWEFSVRDNGPGIEPRYHDRIFRIFQTLVARDKVEGTGIGLATVKKLVESRGGRVWVDSRPGEGAVFSFVWPKPEPAIHEASS